MVFGSGKHKSKNTAQPSSDDINVCMEGKEYIANKYVMNCFGVTIPVYTAMSVCSSIYNIVSGSLEKARLADEKEKAKPEAENTGKARSCFLAGMSNEIKTPINAVNGMNEMKLRESRPVYTAPDAKILAVDDNVINLKVFKTLLKQTKIKIYEAESGQECLDLMKRESFDMVFLDHMMPEMDGIETLRRIRADGLGGVVPIIMLTANTMSGEREQYISQGFDDYLSKPIIPAELDRMILHYLPSELIAPETESGTVPEPVSAPSGIEALHRLLPEINIEKGLASCGGDEDFYLELFKDYTELPVREELTGYLRSGDYKNYCIRIHGFKSNSYSLGAVGIGDLAYEMEKLTRDGLPDEIVGLQDILFEKYDNICQNYKKVTG